MVEAGRRFPHARFRIIGAARDGFDEVLREQIARLDVQNVLLEGSKSQQELLEIMRNSDIFVLPSRLEGMPKVTLEAAATGLPSIVFRDYETPSVIDRVTGFFCASPNGEQSPGAYKAVRLGCHRSAVAECLS